MRPLDSTYVPTPHPSTLYPQTLSPSAPKPSPLKEGFGFITPDASGAPLFFHFSELGGNQKESVVKGTNVRFRVKPAEKNSGRPTAVEVSLVPKGTPVFLPKLDKVTPMADRAPPVVDRAPPKFDRAPPKVDRAPYVVDRAPPVVDRAPYVVDRAPHKVVAPPGLPTQAGRSAPTSGAAPQRAPDDAGDIPGYVFVCSKVRGERG